MRTSTKPEIRLFRKHISNSNFMTPDIIAYHTNLDYICEISAGYDMLRNVTRILYGCTVFNKKTLTHEGKKSNCFYSLQSTIDYIRTLS